MRRNVDLENIGKICLARNVEIKDDSTIKFRNETVNVSDIIPHITRGQLDFICSFIYCLTVIEQTRGGDLRDAVLRLYNKIDYMGLDVICQTGFRGVSGVIEYVRPEDMLAILYRMKCIDFPLWQGGFEW